MDDLINLFIWSIGVFSATNIIVVSKIFAGFRKWVTYKSIVKTGEGKDARFTATPRKFMTISNLVHCPMCLGFWLGLLAGIFVYSPTTYILMSDSNDYINHFNDGLIGSMLCWIYYLILNKYQSKG